MDTLSRHLLCEYWGCDPALLDDPARLERAMRRAAEAARATTVRAFFHELEPQGVSGILVLEESHFSLHSWPECGYAAVGLFTCGDCRPDQAHAVLSEELGAERAEVLFLARGQRAPRAGIAVLHHHSPGAQRADRGAPFASLQVGDES